jgi:hypothetical protein
MGSKIILTIVICLSFGRADAQMNSTTGSDPVKYFSGNHFSDSLELRAFSRLVSFIAFDPSNQYIEETNMEPRKHVNEEHILVAPIARGATAEPTQNMSWDKSLPVVYNKEELQGSPFLLSSYVPGLVVNDLSRITDKPDYRYNYDKMSGNLLLLRDHKLPIAVNKEQVKYFCLKTKGGGFIFERVAMINPNEYCQVLFKGPRFSFYKMFHSKFIPANQETNGYWTEGKDYDEYQDFYTFYLVDQVRGEPIVIELSKKSIRKSLPAEITEVEQYFKAHKYEEISESYVTGLVRKINN